MIHLLKLEWKKLSPNRSFRVTIGMYIVLLPLLYLTVKSSMKPGGVTAELAIIESFYQFPNIWETMSYWASWLTFFLLVYLSVWIITSEINYKTMRQNLITGMNRREYLLGKILLMAALAVFATIYMAGITLFFGCMSGGYGKPFTEEAGAIWRFFLQNMFYMSFAFMLGIILKRSGLTMIIFFAYVLIVERIIRYLVFSNLIDNLKGGSYFPASAAWDVVPFYVAKRLPSLVDDFNDIILPYNLASLLTVGYSLLFLGIAYKVFMSRDL
jgi:ABC-2 type transport system permease protein